VTTHLLVPHGFEANYVVGFARGLAANGIRLLVVSDGDTAPMLEAAGIPHRNLRGSVDPKRSSWSKALNLVRYYLRLAAIIVRHRHATVHFCGLLGSRIILFDGIFLPLWLRFWSTRYVHTAHNALPHGREQQRIFYWAYRWIYRFPHTILAHTDKVAGQLTTDFGVDPARIEVISIGLNEEVPATTLSTSAARLQLGLPATGPIALFFGKVEPYKGVDVLVEAWNTVRTPQAHLAIAGTCPDADYAASVRATVARSARPATVEWRSGFVANDQVAIWLKACDLVVMPYRHIYQSGVVFLCLRFGVPIVATNVGSLADYVESSGVIAITNDPNGLAEALDRGFSLLETFDRNEIARRAEKYRWEHQCAAIKHLYE